MDIPRDFCSLSQSEKRAISLLIINIHVLSRDRECHYDSQISSEGN
jgi:hypothetical protein